MTVGATDKSQPLLRKITDNLPSYIDLVDFPIETADKNPQNQKLIQAAVDARVLLANTGEDVPAGPNSDNFFVSPRGLCSGHYRNTASEHNVILSPSQLHELGFQPAEAVSVLKNVWDVIEKRVQAKTKIYPKPEINTPVDKNGTPTDKALQKNILHLAAKRIKTLQEDGIKINWDDNFGNVFRHGDGDELVVNRTGLRADPCLFTPGELNAWGLSNRLENFLDENITKIKTLTNSSSLHAPEAPSPAPTTAEYAATPSPVARRNVPAQKTGTPEKSDPPDNTEDPKNSAEKLQNSIDTKYNVPAKKFLEQMTQEQKTALGITATTEKMVDDPRGRGYKVPNAMVQLQTALNRENAAGLNVDGLFGEKTNAAFGAWKNKNTQKTTSKKDTGPPRRTSQNRTSAFPRKNHSGK